MRIPSHSTVAAYAALFIALGGTATAATALRANSVGSPQIRNGSVKMTDLATDARPSSKSILFRQAVTAVVLDPNTQAVVDSLAGAVKGTPGDAGPAGPAVQGPQGSAGSNGKDGANGPRGESLGFGHVTSGGGIIAADSTSNVAAVRVGVGHYCLNSSVGSNLVVTIDRTGDNAPTLAVPQVATPDPATTSCPPNQRWEVSFIGPSGGSGVVAEDHAFYFLLN